MYNGYEESKMMVGGSENIYAKVKHPWSQWISESTMPKLSTQDPDIAWSEGSDAEGQ